MSTDTSKVRYVVVPFEQLSTALAMAGFTQGPTRPGKEVVLSRPVRGGLRINVWTSTREGQVDAVACGADAIRVTLVYTSPNGHTSGVSSATKILRTGSVEKVIERILERARKLWQLGARMDAAPKCLCGAPKYIDSGSCVDRKNPLHARNMAQASVVRSTRPCAGVTP